MSPTADQKRFLDSLIRPQASIREAIARLDRAGTGALLLTEENGKLTAILTDGDIRRAILRGLPLERTCSTIANHQPIVAPSDVSQAEALHVMNHSKDYVINHLPLVDGEGRATGLLLRSDLVADSAVTMSAVIMAGGLGTRLMPLTENTPKPMLPVGDRPLLELIIDRLRDAGISRVNITTHYRPERITEHFGNGHNFGVDLQYVEEDRPLGTAGALKLMEERNEPLLVINGDILTGLDFRDMLTFHRKHHPDATVGVRKYEVQLPYGVIETEGPYVSGLREKPVMSFLVNAGIYLLEPSVYRYIPDAQRYDMTQLIEQLLQEGRPVVGFPIVEYWRDIGQRDDYEQAQRDISEGVFVRGRGAANALWNTAPLEPAVASSHETTAPAETPGAVRQAKNTRVRGGTK